MPQLPLNDPWPTPEFDEQDQPHFLFIVTPPYSGSTALAQLINTSEQAMMLNKNGEGQWLVPGLSYSRWDPNKRVNYESVKAVWLSTFQKHARLHRNVRFVIEKSPPNMLRLESLASLFVDVSYLANNRNPFANCASILYRNHDANNLERLERLRLVTTLAKRWLLWSELLIKLITRYDIPLITYEEFCENPASVLELLKLPDGACETINTQANVKVKDYPQQPIINQNQRQVSKLTKEEVGKIWDLLEPKSDVLAFFGYENESDLSIS